MRENAEIDALADRIAARLEALVKEGIALSAENAEILKAAIRIEIATFMEDAAVRGELNV